MAKNNNKKTLFQKLKYKYKLIVINEDTFEQKASLRLSRFNLYTLGSAFVLFIVLAITSLIAFTPIKFFLPGVGTLDVRSKLIEMEMLTDSLNNEMEKRNFWMNNVQKILAGELDSSYYFSDSSLFVSLKEIDLSKPSSAELAFREKNELNTSSEGEFSANVTINNLNMIRPIEGYITREYALNDNHVGIDIAAKEGDPVKSILDGIVIVNNWNPETGNVIGIQHENNIVSFYKHNSILLKKVGSFVNKGEVIALVGNSGNLTSGTHLHFELWIDAKSVNPLVYLFFEKLN